MTREPGAPPKTARGARDRDAILSGPILLVLLKLSWPTVIALFLQQGIQTVTVFWLGRLSGTIGLSVASIWRPVQNLLEQMRNFVPEGSSVLVARSVGKDDSTGMHVVANATWFMLSISLAMAIAGLVLLGPTVELLAGNLSLHDELSAYVVTWLIVQPIVAVSIVLNVSVTAGGWTRFGMVRNGLALVLLIPLFPLLMSVLDLGIAGANLAVGASSLVVGVVTWHAIRANKDALRLGSWPRLRDSFVLARWRAITSIGLPAQLARSVDFLALLLLMRVVMRDGLVAVAGFGVALALYLLASNMTMAIARTAQMIVGQNVGAGRNDRAVEVVRVALALGCVLGVVNTLLFGHLEPVVRQFSSDPAVIEQAQAALDILRLSFPALAAHQILLNVFTALQRNKLASTISIAFAVVNVVLAYTLPLSGLQAAVTSMTITYWGRALVLAGLWRLARLA